VDAPAEVAGSAGRSLADLLKGVQLAGFQPEDREEDDYRKDVEGYLHDLREAAPIVGISKAMDRGDSEMSLVLRNPTESNLVRVQLILRFEADVFVFDPEDEFYTDQTLPKPPRLWGTLRPPSFMQVTPGFPYHSLVPSPHVPRIPRMHIEQSGSATISFEPIDLRPRASEGLAPFHLFVMFDLAGTEMEATWEATSTSADGVASGTLQIRVADTTLALDELLREQEPTAEV
jgi:hypothetical protein